jgi:ribosomal-protein-alanine N-acetyltransferase
MSAIRLDCGVCSVRVWRPDDVDSLVVHANSRNVWLGVRDRFPHPYTHEVGVAWLARLAGEAPPTALAIDVDGEAVGGIGLVLGEDVNSHTGELGYWLGERYWGLGIATASVRVFGPWACKTFDLERLVAHVFSNNLPSVRVLEKCGFEREGVLRRHAKKDGVYLDEIVFGWTAVKS